jgi:hypothetical protein
MPVVLCLFLIVKKYGSPPKELVIFKGFRGSRGQGFE